jgi:hypothetical protein
LNLQSRFSYLSISKYGDFALTDAIRPGSSSPIVPRPGYRLERRRDASVLVAAVSKEKLFGTFLELLSPMSALVDVVLETSHDQGCPPAHQDFFRSEIDLPVLQSYCYDYEDLLLNDGCTGVAVIDNENRMEVQFDEHKILIIYADDLSPFVGILGDNGIARDDQLRLVLEAEHIHVSNARFAKEFEQLSCRMGMSEALAWC